MQFAGDHFFRPYLTRNVLVCQPMLIICAAVPEIVRTDVLESVCAQACGSVCADILGSICSGCVVFFSMAGFAKTASKVTLWGDICCVARARAAIK